MGKIILGDNMEVLPGLASESVGLIYVDPPFNSGKRQERTRIAVTRDEQGDRVGFGGRRYRTEERGTVGFGDSFDDFCAWLEPRLREGWRILKGDGSFFLHLDYREVHYAKVLMDGICGRERFINEIIWAYDYGGRPRNRWPAKHDTILWYARDPENYVFNYDEIDRIPYLAPGLVGAEKAARGKTPTDVWWNTIVPTNSRERNGYPTQKPLGILNRIVRVHSRPGDTVLDFFAGSGTTGEAAWRNGREFILIDNSPEAVKVMAERLGEAGAEVSGDSVSREGTGPGGARARMPAPRG